MMRPITALLAAGLVAAGPSARSMAQSGPALAAGDTLRIDLHEAYRIARTGNWRITEASSRLDRVEADRLTVQESLLPTITPALHFSKHRDRLQNTEGLFLDVDKQAARTGAGVLLAWRPSEVVFNRAAARADAQSATANKAATERDALWEVTRRYVNLASAEEGLEIATRMLTTLVELDQELSSRVDLGLSSAVDRLRLQPQIERQRADVIRARVAREAAMAELAFTLGLSIPPRLQTAGFPAAAFTVRSLSAATEEALRNRSDLAEAQAAADAARHKRSSWTYGRLLPDLLVDYSPSLLGPTFGSGASSYDINVLLAWKVGPGGLMDFGRRRAADADVDLARMRVNETKSQISTEVAEAHVAAAYADSLEAAAVRSAQAAENVMKLTHERDERGLSLPYEIVQATDAWQRANGELTRARAEAALARARFELVLERPSSDQP